MKYLFYSLICFVLKFQNLSAFESESLFSKFFSSCTLREDEANQECEPKSSKEGVPDFKLLMYAQELVQGATSSEIKLLKNLDLFLTTPHEGILKTWILKSLQGQDYYCQTPLELLKTYQVYQFFMNIPKNKEELVEAYLYILCYGRDLDRMVTLTDLSKKSSFQVYEDYSVCVSFLKEIENSRLEPLPLGPGMKTIESLKEVLTRSWLKVLEQSENYLLNLSIDSTHTLQKEMKNACLEAQAFKEKVLPCLCNAEGQVTLDHIDEIIDLQEQFIAQESGKKRTSFEKTHWAKEALDTLPFQEGISFDVLLNSSNPLEKRLAFLMCLEADMMHAEVKTLAWQEAGLLYKGLQTVLKYEFQGSWEPKIVDLYEDLKGQVES